MLDHPDLVRSVILFAAGGKVPPKPAAEAALFKFFNPAAAALTSPPWLADEGGVSFSLPGQFGLEAAHLEKHDIRRQVSQHGDITLGGGPGDVGEFVEGQCEKCRLRTSTCSCEQEPSSRCLLAPGMNEEC
jgi:hypothetical protein